MWISKWFAKSGPSAPASPTRQLRILAVSIPREDLFLLQHLAGQRGWELKSTRSAPAAFELASRGGFDMILCHRNQSGYPWREVMVCLAENSPESCIFLVSPTRDDYLWWDVLSHGGFDVLIRPLRSEIVLRTVESAARCRFGTPVCSSN
jgi:hypothetical protein